VGWSSDWSTSTPASETVEACAVKDRLGMAHTHHSPPEQNILPTVYVSKANVKLACRRDGWRTCPPPEACDPPVFGQPGACVAQLHQRCRSNPDRRKRADSTSGAATHGGRDSAMSKPPEAGWFRPTRLRAGVARPEVTRAVFSRLRAAHVTLRRAQCDF